jgi:error-prone DNA polymerase
MFTGHTYYSLRYGTMSPERLVTLAKEHGIKQLVLADINNTTAMPEFVRLCRQHGIRPIAGIEFRRGGQMLYIVLARNPAGFTSMNRFLSRHNIEGIPIPDRYPVCGNTLVIYPFNQQWRGYGPSESIHPTEAEVNENVFAGIQPADLTRLLTSPLRHHPEKLLALYPITFATKSDFELHRYLRAIDHNIVLSHLQPHQAASLQEVFPDQETAIRLYECFPQLLINAEKLFEQCEMDFDFTTPKNKKTFTGHPADDRALLHKLAIDGIEYRYGKSNKEALRRVLHELDIIDKLGFSSYFLITWDIIRYSMSRGFYHVGRGSGANSIVAYCLRITNVDPIELDLYFERFINPKRSTPPDFDIDYSWKDRDQVLDYIFKRYGHKHTALLGTISTFRDRSMVRELGKVLGLPKAELDTLVKQHEARQNPDKPTRKIIELSSQLADFPNMRSIHAGGVLISEEPIWCYSALDLPPKGLPVVQWDMYVAEELCFEKIDILSQRGIGHINDCVQIVKQNQGTTVDVHQVERFKKDDKVRTLLRSGETTGCFYVESPAMRGLLKKLRCDNYISLVAASSIIRPGVSRSGMMRAYIERFHHPEKIQYLHPVMEQQLKETYGVMVYQEDVIKVCHHFAGLDLADADVLRRAMSGKYRSKKEMQRITDRFFSNCREKGYPDELTGEVWRQIESFAGYSFSKAHSASFAVESYQSLFLKAHYPLEFMTAVVNNFGGFYRSEVYFNEARRLGANIQLPCVNNSQLTTIIKGRDVYIGFVHIQNLEHKLAEKICMLREQDGLFVSLDNFTERTGASLEQLLILIRINAFRFTRIPKAQLMWMAHLLTGKKPDTNPGLFPSPVKKFHLPEPEADPVQDAYDEMELLGHCVSISPFDLLQTTFRGEVMAGAMHQHTGQTVRMLGWLVAIKYVRTIKKETMHFGCFIDHQGDFFDTVHFPQASKSFPFRGNGVYLLKGTICNEFGFPSLTVDKMARLPLRPDPRSR